MRVIRALGLVALGFFAGTATAAAVVRRAVPSRGDADSDEVALIAIFDGIELASRATAFRGGSMFAWYGGIAVDLRVAQLAAEGAHLELHAVNGGIAVRVPEGWRVTSSMRALVGGVNVSVPEPPDPDAPTLNLDGFALFGGVAVGASADSAPPES